MPEIILMSKVDKDILVKSIGHIAKQHSWKIQTCGINGNYTRMELKSGLRYARNS